MFAASVVQTKRAVCLSSDQCTLRRVDAVPAQPGLVVGEVAAHRPTRTGWRSEQAQPVGHVGAGAAPVLHEVVDQEGERDVLHLTLDELLGEFPGKVIRWSVAMEPVTATGTGRSLWCGSAERPHDVGCAAAEQAPATV